MSRALACLVLVAMPTLALAHAPLATTVQFDREIVRILDNHCVMCHEEKGPAFPLVTYEQTYAARWKIRQDALSRHMAPWAAVAGYGDFANNNGLTQREIDFLVSWAESYGPRNNGAVYTGIAATTSAPKVIQAHFDSGHWRLGDPDLLLPLPPNTIKPQPSTWIQRVILDPGLTSDHWLRGLEYEPGDRRVVHAVSFTIQETGQWIGSWTPWYGFFSLPTGLSYKLPARSHIIAEIQYHGANEPVADRGSLGLYFTTAASQHMTNPTLMARAAVPGAGGKLVATTKLDTNTHILAVQPEIHRGVQSIEVAAREPNGVTRVLLFAKDIPLEWPTPYVFRNPVLLSKGTELSVTEYYAGDSSLPAGGIPVLFSAGPAESAPEQR